MDKILWYALQAAGISQYYDEPYLAFPEPIWGITTRPGFIFDDSFWDVFHSLALHICHVTVLVNEGENFGLERAFDLRFKLAAAHG